MTGFGQVAFKSQANGSLITVNGKVVGSKLAAQALHRAALLPRAAVGDLARLQRRRDDVRQPRADEPDAREERPGRGRRDPEARGALQPGPDDPRHPRRRRHDLRLRDRPGHLARLRAAAGAADRRRPPPAARDRAAADLEVHDRPLVGLLRRARRERARAQPRPRPAGARDGAQVGQHLLARPRASRAVRDSFPKLDPRLQLKNPVMFIVELGSVITTGIFVARPRARPHGQPLVRRRDRVLALADGAVRELRRGDRRGARQGAGERAARDAHDHDALSGAAGDGRLEEVPAPELQRDDVVVVEAGMVIPADGEIIEGVGSVDESAITGESAPVIREAGGDRSAVTGGTKLLSDRLVIQVTQEPGQVVPRPHDRARRGRRAAQDAERDRAQHPARGADDHLPRRRRHAQAVRDLRRHASSRRPC